MFDIAVCCDDITRLEHLCSLLEEYRREHPQRTLRVSPYQSLYDLSTGIRGGTLFHLYLLDHRYELWMNGLTPEQVLRREDPAGLVVSFVTDPRSAFTQPVAHNPLGISARLPKPADGSQLLQVLEGLIQGETPPRTSRTAQSPPAPRSLPARTLSFPTPEGVRELPFDAIVHLSYDDHVVICCLAGGEVLRGSTLRPSFYWTIWPLTKESNFSQVSAARLVNMDYLLEVDQRRGALKLTDGWEVAIPKTSVPYFLEQYRQYRQLSGKDPVPQKDREEKRSPGRPRKAPK